MGYAEKIQQLIDEKLIFFFQKEIDFANKNQIMSSNYSAPFTINIHYPLNEEA